MARNKFRRARSCVTKRMWPLVAAAQNDGSVTLTYAELRKLVSDLEADVKQQTSSAYTAGSISGW